MLVKCVIWSKRPSKRRRKELLKWRRSVSKMTKNFLKCKKNLSKKSRVN